MKDLQPSFLRLTQGARCTCLVFVRAHDKHELSLSTYERNLVHFDEKGDVVKDYGNYTSTETLLQAVEEFLGERCVSGRHAKKTAPVGHARVDCGGDVLCEDCYALAVEGPA